MTCIFVKALQLPRFAIVTTPYISPLPNNTPSMSMLTTRDQDFV
jgi:hypothetical protein